MRGEKLRHHILWTAKDVFLAEGFERAGMETIANRAGTTKRTLYAHFANKEALFLAVVELVQELFTGKLGEPGDYADEPVEALTRFCGQLRRTMLWGPSIRTVRLGIAEAERFPLGAANLYRVLLGSAGDAIARFLGERANLLPDEARTVADRLVRRSLEPDFSRALFGTRAVPEEWPEDDAADREVVAAGVRQVAERCLRPTECSTT